MALARNCLVNEGWPMSLVMADLWNALGTGAWASNETSVNQPITEVVVDSRQAVSGSLFVALPGERVNGHDFVKAAFDRGALAAIVEKPIEGCAVLVDLTTPLIGQPPAPPICLKVPDSLAALQDLAAYWRRRQPDCRVVGVTGSIGKTTTKELIASVLGQRYATLKSEGNYNNEIGLPLTMLRLHSGVNWAVQEMGMYDLGEIAHLASIALPEAGVVTNVGPTHLERLGTLERISRAKAELVQALPEDGLAVLNGDDERVRAMSGMTPASRVILYGLDPSNYIWADKIHSYGLEGLRLRFHQGDQTVHARLPLLGRHSVYGALAAVAVGLSTGLAWDEVISGLRDPTIQVRLGVIRGVHGTTLLDDTYNASPASTVAALNLLAEMDGRKIAVLGDMLELGKYEAAGHRLVGRRAAELVAVLVAVGELGGLIGQEALAAGMPESAVHLVSENDQAVSVLEGVLEQGDFVLVKGSRGMAMENIVSQLARGE
jgi:UDP-N-acetylmuramoyl-tripeptide--D-alanyl-D-alanine ligase